MPITEKRRRARIHNLGSSDGPPILGVSCFGRTITDVYWSKQELEASAPTEAMQTGNRLEGPLLDFYQEQSGNRVKRNQYRISHGRDGGVLAANLDGLVVGKPEGIECKYVGGSHTAEWGPEGTDEVPNHVIIQVQHQMYVAELKRVWVAAAVAGYALDWRLYCVERNEELIEIIVERELRFWHDNVLAGVPPEPGPPPLEVMQALRREPGSIVQLDDAAEILMIDYASSLEAIRLNERHRDHRKASLLALLGEAEGGRLPDGTLVTYLQQNSPPRCDLKRLRAEQPTIYEKYVTQGTHRVLRIKRPKEAITDESQNSVGAAPEPGRITDASADGANRSPEQPAHAGSAGGNDGGEAVPT